MSRLPTVLVVDDELDERESLGPALSEPEQSLMGFHGCGPFHVDVAECGRRAEEMLETKSKREIAAFGRSKNLEISEDKNKSEMIEFLIVSQYLELYEKEEKTPVE